MTTVDLRQRTAYGRDLVVHLVWRELQLRYRRTAFGWFWAVAQPLARIAVLAFVFTRIARFDIPRYPLFLFVGVITWAWFSAGVSSATTSAVDRRDLLFRPGMPRLAVPLTSIATDLVDYLLALPILLAAIALFGGGTSWWALIALPVLLLLQGLLILGVGALLCTANVLVRDVRLLVDVVLMLGFYLTPVFYDMSIVPAEYHWVFRLNPMTHVVEAQRAVLLYGIRPSAWQMLLISAISCTTAAIGLWVYSRRSPTFVDEL